jgi:hypothetical protein
MPVYYGIGTDTNKYLVTDFDNNIFFHGTYLMCWCEMKRLEQL